MNDATPEPRQCRICGYPLDSKNRTGLCSNKTPACREARRHLTSDEKPGKFRVAIKAGGTFGLWTALEDYDRTTLDVLCRCACGKEKRLGGSELTYGRTKGCPSCSQKNRKRPAREPYLGAGSVFGRLTLLEDAAYAHDRPRWRCEDGNECEIDAASVKFGKSRSCGCLHREVITKHGLSKHPYYDIWKGIIARCENPNSRGFEGYGFRGVTICARWRDGLSAFIDDIERELGPRPEGRYETTGRVLYELDRTNNDGGYWCGHCPDCISRGQTVINVRWSDRPTQMQNRRKIPKLTRDVMRLTEELEAALARAAELEAAAASLAPRKRKVPAPASTSEPLF
jgi:hypothetical protein